MFARYYQSRVFSTNNSLRSMGTASGAGLGPDINVLVWNIYKGRKRGWLDDFRALAQQHDLVLLQEAVCNSRHDAYFARDTRIQWLMGRSFQQRMGGLITGVKTGAITASDFHLPLLSPHQEPLFKTPKSALLTRYPLAGSSLSLMVCNVHAINFVSWSKFDAQLQQLIDPLSRHEGPMILAGDFNTWNTRRLHRLFEISESLALQEARIVRQSRLAHLLCHLDHVFYRGLKLIDTASLENIRSSDHAPISATFQIT